MPTIDENILAEQFVYTNATHGARKANPLHCGGCDQVKSPGDFYMRKRGYPSYPCKSCALERRACKKYGITPEEYRELRSRTACDLCGGTDKNKHGWAFHIDHNHTTGRVRGVLCHFCNVMIGMARENPAILDSAKTYLGGE